MRYVKKRSYKIRGFKLSLSSSASSSTVLIIQAPSAQSMQGIIVITRLSLYLALTSGACAHARARERDILAGCC